MFWKRKTILEPVQVGPMDPHGLAIREHQSSGKQQSYECRNISDSSIRMYLCSSMYVLPSATQAAVVEKAISLCRGRVLDIGAGAGYASLKLQQAGFDVTALDLSEYCAEAMRSFGVKKVVLGNIKEFTGDGFDTFLFLDSSLGCVGLIRDIEELMANLRTSSSPGAQIIVHDGIRGSGLLSFEWEGYFRYKHFVGEPFRWSSISASRLAEIGSRTGWELSELSKPDHDGRLLMILTQKISG